MKNDHLHIILKTLKRESNNQLCLALSYEHTHKVYTKLYSAENK